MTRVLVTGATGLVGSEVLERLAREPGVEAVGTSRRGGPGVVPWDLAARPCPSRLRRRWDAVVHTAADVRWTLSPAEARRANVDTVAGLVPLVSARTHVVHVSTAYVLGRDGTEAAHGLSVHRNTYEWSKAEAERLARARFARLTIVRPPLVVGRRSDGRAARFAGVFRLLRGIATGSLPAIAADAGARVDIVPVDDLAALLVECALTGAGPDPGPLVQACGEAAPGVEEVVRALLDGLNGWRADRGVPPLEMPRLIALDSWHRFFRPFARAQLTDRQNRMLDLLGGFEPYLEGAAPITPTHPVADVMDAIRRSGRYWATRKPHAASLPQRPWHVRRG